MITVNELFSGIGSQSAALERLGIDFKVVGIAEIDKYAIKSYEAIYGTTRNYGDISKIEKLDYADFWTYSFPCQDISVAGKQRGINENTRSGLLYEVERLLYKSIMYGEQPKYLMLENVKNLVGKQFKPQFDEWLKRLDELGYNTYWKVLNAKNYGIPQNRERVFAISIRKDIDTGYEFPIGFDNGKRLKDILESEVDEKYYISNERVNKLINKATSSEYCNKKASFVPSENKSCYALGSQEFVRTGFQEDCLTLSARDYKDPKCVVIKQATKQGYIECNIPGVADLSFPDSKTRRGGVQENGEICPTLTAGTQDLCYIDLPCIGASRGRNLENPSDRTPGNKVEQRLEPNKNGTSNTITTVQKDNYVIEPKILDDFYSNRDIREYEDYSPTLRSDRVGLKVVEPMIIDPQGRLNKQCTPRNFCPTLRAQTHGNLPQVTYPNTDFRIRKLTPKECWRLMGFTDDQFHKAAEVNSNSQLYKQAGNSIVVDVLYYLFKNLFDKN